MFFFFIFLFQAEDGIRDLVRSRGLGDVYKRQVVEDKGNSCKINHHPDYPGKDAAGIIAR